MERSAPEPVRVEGELDPLLVVCEREGILAVGQPVELRFRDGTATRIRITEWTERGVSGTDLRVPTQRKHPVWADILEVHQI
jgi:hypothetical protein